MRKFPGGSELTLRVKISLDQPVTSVIKKEVIEITIHQNNFHLYVFSFLFNIHPIS